MPSDDALTLLREIRDVLRELRDLSRQRTVRASNGNVAGQSIASDRDLDGKFGNPVIKSKDPRDWSGVSMKGRRFSECPPEYLELFAERLDYFAQKAEQENEKATNGQPKAKYLRADAARCRGWIARMRSGKHAPPPVESSDAGWSVVEDDKEEEVQY